MQLLSLLLVLLGLTLAQGKQEILEKQGTGYDLDDTQSYPPRLHSEETQGYDDAPVAKALKCPSFQYFDCKKCVPIRNGDDLCACDGWTYDEFSKECQPPSGTPPSNCEANLQQCRNDMQRAEQELQNCRQNCGQKPSQPPPQQPGRFEYDSNGDYRCKFVPSNGGGYPGQPCTGPLKPDFQRSPRGKQFRITKRGGNYLPVELSIYGPAVLEISDRWHRVAQYEVRINGQSPKRTSATQFNRRVKCGLNMDDCIRLGFSHGFFQIPPGLQNVQIYWVNGEFLWSQKRGLYRVFEACPGQP